MQQRYGSAMPAESSGPQQHPPALSHSAVQTDRVRMTAGRGGTTPRMIADIPQLRISSILGIWAAAALPMAGLAWIVAPALASTLGGQAPLVSALLVCMTAGLIWQSVLAMVLVHREQGSVRWSVLRDALWLRRPRSPKAGRAGRRL